MNLPICRTRSPTMGHALSGLPESGQVYVRKDGSTTEEIPDGTGKFLTASADGSRVLLTDGLEYDVEDLGEAPVDLSEGKGGFVGIVGQSKDLSTVYFIDTAILTSEPDGQGAVAQPGGKNLYVRHEVGTATFIASLAPTDSEGHGRPGKLRPRTASRRPVPTVAGWRSSRRRR